MTNSNNNINIIAEGYLLHFKKTLWIHPCPDVHEKGTLSLTHKYY